MSNGTWMSSNWGSGGMSFLNDVTIQGREKNMQQASFGITGAMPASYFLEGLLAEMGTGGVAVSAEVAWPVTLAVAAGGFAYFASTLGTPYKPTFEEAAASGSISSTAGSAAYRPERPKIGNLNDIMAGALATQILVHQMSKGGHQNVWPDGEYDKPNIPDINWELSDSQLADQITGSSPNGGKGPGSSWSKIKKWFRDVRRKINNKRR